MRSARRRSRRGQSLVESALAIPIIVVLCLGVADGGRAFYQREAVTNATRQALRAAQVESSTSGAGNTACAGTTSPAVARQLTSHIPWQSGDPVAMKSIDTATALESSSDGTASGSRISGATLLMTWHCLNGAVITNTTATALDPASAASAAIEAKLTYNFQLITPTSAVIFGSASPPIRSDVVGRADY